MSKSTQEEVRVIDLVKRYKKLVAVDQLNLTINKGDIFGLLGPNGSGKTTLINCCLSLLNYEHGEIYIFGKKMSPSAYEIKQNIGLVPQQIACYNELNVYENIDYFCSLYVSDRTKRKKLVEEAIDFVQLGDFRKMRPKKLSGGLQRRLNLACGIAHKPRLIFLDEPTVAVDPQSRNRILEGIRELRDQGSTIVYTTHYMEEVEMICNRLAILDHGKVLREGTSEDIIENSSIGETHQFECYQLPGEVLEHFEKDPRILHVDYKDNRELTLRVVQGESYLLTILQILAKHNVEPLSVNSKKPTLNDVFLEITGKELRDHA